MFKHYCNSKIKQRVNVGLIPSNIPFCLYTKFETGEERHIYIDPKERKQLAINETPPKEWKNAIKKSKAYMKNYPNWIKERFNADVLRYGYKQANSFYFPYFSLFVDGEPVYTHMDFNFISNAKKLLDKSLINGQVEMILTSFCEFRESDNFYTMPSLDFDNEGNE